MSDPPQPPPLPGVSPGRRPLQQEQSQQLSQPHSPPGRTHTRAQSTFVPGASASFSLPPSGSAAGIRSRPRHTSGSGGSVRGLPASYFLESQQPPLLQQPYLPSPPLPPILPEQAPSRPGRHPQHHSFHIPNHQHPFQQNLNPHQLHQSYSPPRPRHHSSLSLSHPFLAVDPDPALEAALLAANPSASLSPRLASSYRPSTSSHHSCHSGGCLRPPSASHGRRFTSSSLGVARASLSSFGGTSGAGGDFLGAENPVPPPAPALGVHPTTAGASYNQLLPPPPPPAQQQHERQPQQNPGTYSSPQQQRQPLVHNRRRPPPVPGLATDPSPPYRTQHQELPSTRSLQVPDVNLRHETLHQLHPNQQHAPHHAHQHLPRHNIREDHPSQSLAIQRPGPPPPRPERRLQPMVASPSLESMPSSPSPSMVANPVGFSHSNQFEHHVHHHDQDLALVMAPPPISSPASPIGGLGGSSSIDPSTTSWADEDLEEILANSSDPADATFPADNPEYWIRFKAGLRDAVAFREELLLQEQLLHDDDDEDVTPFQSAAAGNWGRPKSAERFKRFADFVESCCPQPLRVAELASSLQSKSPSQQDLASVTAASPGPGNSAGGAGSRPPFSSASSARPSISSQLPLLTPIEEVSAAGPDAAAEVSPTDLPLPSPRPTLDGKALRELTLALGKAEDLLQQLNQARDNWERATRNSRTQIAALHQRMETHLHDRADYVDRLRKHLAMRPGTASQDKLRRVDGELRESRQELEIGRLDMEVGLRVHRLERQKMVLTPLADILRSYAEFFRRGYELLQPFAAAADTLSEYTELQASKIRRQATAVRRRQAEWESYVVETLGAPSSCGRGGLDSLGGGDQQRRGLSRLLHKARAKFAAGSNSTAAAATGSTEGGAGADSDSHNAGPAFPNQAPSPSPSGECTPMPGGASASTTTSGSGGAGLGQGTAAGAASSGGSGAPEKAGFLFVPQPKFLPIWVQIRESTLVVCPVDFTLTRVYRSEDRYFPLKHCAVESASKTKLRCAFYLNTPNIRLLLQAETEQEQQDWMQSLQQTISSQQLIAPDSFSPRPSVVAGSADAPSGFGNADPAASAAAVACAEFGIGSSGDPALAAGADGIRGSAPAAVPEEPPEPTEEQIKLLETLWIVPGNSHCADCNAPQPSCVVLNLGIMICTTCAVAHRSLGVHVSKPRPATPETVDRFALALMRTLGNANVNAIFEKELRRNQAHHEEKPVVNSNSVQREFFMRRKYAEKAYTEEIWIEPEKVLRLMYDSIADDLSMELFQAIVWGADHSFQHPQEEGRTPLAQAVMYGDPVMVEMLIQNMPPGKDILRQQELRGWTPLHYAAYQDDRDLVELLLWRGGNALVVERDWDSNTPLDACCQHNENPQSLGLLQAAMDSVRARKGFPLSPSKSEVVA